MICQHSKDVLEFYFHTAWAISNSPSFFGAERMLCNDWSNHLTLQILERNKLWWKQQQSNVDISKIFPNVFDQQRKHKKARSMPGVFYCLRNASNPWGNQCTCQDIWHQIIGIPMHLGDTEVAKVTACSAVDDALYAGTRTTVRPAKRAGIYCLPYYISCFIGIFFHIIYVYTDMFIKSLCFIFNCCFRLYQKRDLSPPLSTGLFGGLRIEPLWGPRC